MRQQQDRPVRLARCTQRQLEHLTCVLGDTVLVVYVAAQVAQMQLHALRS